MTLLAGAVTLSILLGAPPLSTKQSIKVDTKFPTVGKKTVITLESPAEVITVIYQPDAPVARKVTLKTHGKLKVAWTPEKAGVVSLRVGKVSKDVSVKFDGTPVGGVLMMLFSGFVLFGGIILCMTLVFKSKPPTEE